MELMQLPLQFDSSFILSESQHGSYLQSVGGGHPVHASLELALLAGFTAIPVAGIHVMGGAMAAFTRQFERNPVQLISVSSRFLHPVYPDDELKLSMTLDQESQVATARHTTGVYAGHCALATGVKVLALQCSIRVLPLKPRE